MNDAKTIEELVTPYCLNEMNKLKKMCASITHNKGYSSYEEEDFFDMCIEILYQCAKSYDESNDTKFQTYLYGCMSRRFNTFIRDKDYSGKRVPTSHIVSIDDENNNLEDQVGYEQSDYNEMIESEYEDKTEKYLARLSKLQRRVVLMLADGYAKRDIIQELHITSKNYEDALSVIRRYDNISILF